MQLQVMNRIIQFEIYDTNDTSNSVIARKWDYGMNDWLETIRHTIIKFPDTLPEVLFSSPIPSLRNFTLSAPSCSPRVGLLIFARLSAVCVCVRVCVYVWERQREIEREHMTVCVCVQACVCVFTWVWTRVLNLVSESSLDLALKEKFRSVSDR